MGASKQPIQTDLDMLTKDFVVRSTSSPYGTKFDEFFSDSYGMYKVRRSTLKTNSTVNAEASLDHPFPYCTVPKDKLYIPSLRQQLPISFPHCKPSKQSRETLGASGAVLGLAPSESLKQIKADSFIEQLLETGMVEHDVFSITLINGEEGLLSIGGTAAESMAKIEDSIEKFLGKSPQPKAAEQVNDPDQDAADIANGAPAALVQGGGGLRKRSEDDSNGIVLERGGLGQGAEERVQPDLSKRPRKGQKPMDSTVPTWKDNWKWSPIEGADGWWQTLMRGVWTDGVKILKNQPCVIDLSTPFVLAPPQAAKTFYASISGSHRLPAPYQSFYAFPCNNPPQIHVEFSGWRFPTMRGFKSYDQSTGPNGKFSLGKVTEESGYCVGAIVETKMGVGDMAPVKRGRSRKEDTMRGLGSLESGMLAGNGMRDVWVLGEPIFRGLGLVFDLKQKQVGFRTY